MMKKLFGMGMMIALVLVTATTLYAQSGGGFSIDWFNVTGGGESSGGQFDLTGSVSVFGGGAATGGGFTLNSGLYPLGSSVPTAVDLATDGTATETSAPLMVGLIALLLLSLFAVRQVMTRRNA